jgi:hypothetical protein
VSARAKVLPVSVATLFRAYQQTYRSTYAHESAEVSEKLAFYHGMIAGAAALKKSLGALHNTTTGRSIAEELEQELKSHELDG